MVNLRVCALDCEALRALLQERPAQCLVLDCRSFFSFNAAHIRGSCNVRLSTIVRRRAKGALALEHVVPNEELRARLRQGLIHTVVLLDERSADLELPKRDSTLLLALGTLCREARGARICFLKGERPGDRIGGEGWRAQPARRCRPRGSALPPAAQRSPAAFSFSLAGGYEAFSSACSELCTKPAAPAGLSLPLSASSAPGSAESGCSSCGTPLYDQVSGGETWERAGGCANTTKGGEAVGKLPGGVNRLFALRVLGWASGNPAVPLLGQRLPCLPKRYAGRFGDHSVNQRVCELPQPL